MSGPGVDLVRHPARASELVLLVHGGQEHSDADPHLWRPALLRMWPFALAARPVAPSAAIGFLRYRSRGWNGGAAAADLRVVLDTLLPEISRVLLIGHSMGGRAVVAAGDHPRVAGVLALAPWLPKGEPLVALRPPVTFAHGTADRVTDPATTMAYAGRLRAAGTPVTTYTLHDENHAMLHRAADWNRVVADFVSAARSSSGTAGGSIELPLGRRGSVAAAVAEIALARLRLPIRERLRVPE
ncbi:alpha/beta fold hydrolase [Kribbella sp. HUAS MG21]|uniref:Alpha/beta fold hydrolase n=1 Tax=Kribbella sp. HUAS MG21 TaxID=3160966 RepID=A0AAU7TNC0_9ACTN